MAEIARAAGVGKATVSLALRNDPRLRQDTRRKIQAVAKKMGYQSNAVVSNLMAQLRVSKNPKYQATLALINVSPTRNFLHTNPTFTAINEGILSRCHDMGYGSNEFWLCEPSIDSSRLKQILHARNIRGVLIAGMADNLNLPPEFDSAWEDISCVTVGIRPGSPPFHFACNDQFSTAQRTAEQLIRLGYTKPGLVIASYIEKVIDNRFTAGFYAGNHFSGTNQRLPVLDYHPEGQKSFLSWLKKHKPDVIVTTHAAVRGWVESCGMKCPKDIGLAHLDINKGMEDWSGMDQKSDLVGGSAVDLLVGLLHRNECGPPQSPMCVMVESQWVAGTTLRS